MRPLLLFGVFIYFSNGCSLPALFRGGGGGGVASAPFCGVTDV